MLLSVADPLGYFAGVIGHLALAVAAVAVGKGALRRLLEDGWPAAPGTPDRLAAGARRGWKRLAKDLGLVLVEQRERSLLTDRQRPPIVHVPALTVSADAYGMVAVAQTLPGLDLERYQKETTHLANEWGVERVEATQNSPGWVRLRALLSDPLLETHTQPAEQRGDAIYLGRDERGQSVWLKLPGLSGMKIGGLPGYGKTLLVMGLAAQLARRDSVQLVVLDGKTADPSHGDWGELLPRAAAAAGDDPAEANHILRALVAELKQRPEQLRQRTGSNRFWKNGPTVETPLIVVIVDESHNYSDTAGLRGAARDVVDENQRLMRTLVKEGRGTGLLPILVTQKQTADAIPTAARDNLEVGICFATTTIEAAEATLGRGIRDAPEAWPTSLVDKQRYVGVCVATGLPGRSGFTRLRVPQLEVPDLAAVAANTADYRRPLPPAPTRDQSNKPGLEGAARPSRRAGRE